MANILEAAGNPQQDGRLSFLQLALLLAQDYTNLYVINAETDNYIEYAPSGCGQNLEVRSSGPDFYADTRQNCRKLVYPDDQIHFLTAFRKEKVLEALKGGKSFTLNYRLVIDGEPKYFFLKAIAGSVDNDQYIVIGVQNVDEQMRREEAAAAQSKAYAQIAKSLASMYEVIYHVDLNNNSYTEYSSHFSKLGLLTRGDDFFEMIQQLISSIIHPDDYLLVSQAMTKDSLNRELGASETFSLTFRQYLDNVPQHVNLLAFKPQNESDHIVIAIRNIEQQVQRENAAAEESETYSHIARSLASRYEVIYYIDLDTDSYTLYSASEQYARLGTTKSGNDFFAAAADDIAKYVYFEDRDSLLQELSKDRLLESLSKTGSVSYTYRQFLDSRTQYVTMMIVRPKNDSKRLVIGVINVDQQMRRELSMANEKESFTEMIKALAYRYEVIYLVNLKDDTFREYSSSSKYAKIKIGVVGDDFFGQTQVNMKRDIYPDDLPMMAERMKKENLLASLEETGSTVCNYRLMMDNVPQFVSLYAIKPGKNSEHIIVAVENVDVIRRKELAYQEALGSAMNMANRDALTGVKNKHAYVQAEMELDTLIAGGRISEFAIVIADVNDLKRINDSQGHSAGDDYIKSACHLICTTFKHSPVFRIGGDEFAVLLKGSDYQEKDNLMEQLSAIMCDNAKKGLVTAAAGISEFIPGKDLRVQDVFERADKAMYECKKKIKGL